MKIALYNVTSSIKFGGIETTVWEIGERLSERGYDVDIITGKGDFISKSGHFNLIQHRYIDRKYFPIKLPRIEFDKFMERSSFALFSLGNLFKKRYDIIQLFKIYDLPIALIYKYLTNCKIILADAGCGKMPMGKLLLKYADVTTACSLFWSDVHKQKFGITPRLIYNGYDEQTFKRKQPLKKLKTELGISNNEKLIVTSCRLVKWKGVQVLLNAMQLIGDQLAIKLIVIGEGPYYPVLNSLAAEYKLENKVVFVGFKSSKEIVDFYSISDIFVASSIGSEPFGIFIAEAMACGLPVIASKSGGIPELVEDGQTGVLFPAGDENALASKITDLIGDKKQLHDLGKNAQARASKYFTWDVITDQYVKLYDELFDGKGY